MRLYYESRLRKNAQNLRKSENLSEVLLWKEIRAKKLGVQFLRQRPIGNYIVDFYCHKLNLAIEIDGGSHDSKVEKDEERQKTLESLGVHFLRFQDRDVRYNLDSVLRDIREEILRLVEIPPAADGGLPLGKGEYSAPPLKKEE